MEIGIFGGSFNPIHTGHAIIASHILQHTPLEQIWFMVAPQNPLKEQQDRGMDIHRLRMTELVSRHISGAETSAFEFGLPQPSYTVNTLRQLALKFPQHRFSLIIGADNWALFPKWKDHDAIISNHDIYIYPRLGSDITIPPQFQRVHAVDAPIVEISSTQIRELAAQGRDIRFLVPDDVYDYIERHNLYANE